MDLHEEIYMRLPQSFHSTIPNAVCKLTKSLYGLKQVSQQWYAKLIALVYTRGYKYSGNDYSLFYKKINTTAVFLALYVDDILLIGDDKDEILALKAYLDDTFKIKDLGEAHFFSWDRDFTSNRRIGTDPNKVC